jgi:muramoyltetrapeptide carboxypeptidase
MLAKSLQKGDIIGVIAPSQPFNQDKKFELDNFIEYMKEQGVDVNISKNFYVSDKYGVSAGTPEQRAEDINLMFSDENIKAIWCLQGGEPANQTLGLIDFENVKNNPKLFMGKSDIDVLLLALNKKTGLITFHCCDTKIGSNKELDFDYTKKWLQKRIFEKSKIIEPSEEWICVNKGKTEGRIIGCNPVSILKLAGTEYFPDFSDSILFLETFRSNPAELIAQLTQFKQLRVFENIKGVVIGNNYEFQSDKFKAEYIVNDFLREYNFPILKINEFGHYQPHAFLPIGAKVELDATNKEIIIMEDFLN